MAKDSYRLEFFGKECPHCPGMEPRVARLEDEEKLQIAKYEVWHSEENAQLWKQYDKNFCGGVPFFYNRRTPKWLCGPVSYEKLREWALGKKPDTGDERRQEL
jgi:thiol-disulfide isomerase/thioredoxin